MCVVSAIIEDWTQKGPGRYPDIWPAPQIVLPQSPIVISEVTKAEFEALRKEVLELKELLKAANKFDAATGQPNCEHEEKIALVKRIAEFVGVEIADVIK